MSTVKGFRLAYRRFTISPAFEKNSFRRDRGRWNAKPRYLSAKRDQYKQTDQLKHRISPSAELQTAVLTSDC